MKYDAPDDYETGGGNWLTEPGTYHLLVTSVTEEPKSRDGRLLDGFKVELCALEGTVRDKSGEFTEKNKTVDIMFWHPKLSDKNNGEFARKKQGRFFIATGLIDETVKGKSVEINLEQAVGHQIIATLEDRDSPDGKKFLDLHFADIYHIDDPAAAKFPRSEKSLRLVPVSHRRDPKSFASGKNGGSSKTQPPAKSEDDVDLDNL